MAPVRTPPHELTGNSPSTDEFSTDNAEQSGLLEKSENERLHQLPPHELRLNPPSADKISTDNAEQSVLLEKPENKQLDQLRSPRREIYFILAKIALVLIFIISYHTFCFIVHYRSIPIGRSGNLGPSFLHFNIVAVITTVAILFVYVALWPVKGVIDEIRAEEFFRLMHAHHNGLPLESVNAVSAPTTGAFDIFMATIHRHCSPLLSSTLFISLLITATSSIAPAALSAGSIGVNVDNSTFLVGALPKDSFLVDGGPGVVAFDDGYLPIASTMAWAENVLNFTNSYYKVTSSEGDHFEYLVPFPPEYTSTMKAYWTTDVIAIDPSCSWQTPTTARFVNTSMLSEVYATNTMYESSWDVTLAESNLTVSIPNDTFVSESGDISGLAEVVTGTVLTFVGENRSSEFVVPLDGSVLFVIDQLEPFTYGPTIPVNLSSVPTYKFPSGDVLAFLLCSPHASIQTRQVWATGNGNLTLGKPQRSQGNIDFYQANYLLSYVLLDITRSGITSYSLQVSTDLVQRFLFIPLTGTEIVYRLAPLSNITAMYKQLIYSAVKPYLSGGFFTKGEIVTSGGVVIPGGVTANVPGGYTEDQMVFTSSLGHVFASAILFLFLTIALVAAQFRKRRVAFTFVNVAAALADSDAPQKCLDMTQFKAAGEEERKVLKLVTSGDGQLNCAYQSIV